MCTCMHRCGCEGVFAHVCIGVDVRVCAHLCIGVDVRVCVHMYA